MEEQKKKVVEMKPQVQRPEKMSYDQLESVAHQLSEQNRQMFAKIQELNMANVFKRLDYLFKVVENGHMFKQDFFEKCIAEIESIMTVPEQEEEPETTNKA
nr:MAG TPA: hypothetical protein [Crassvirales sp.]